MRYSTLRYFEHFILVILLIVLAWIFYYPKNNPLLSRYVYYADSFERSAPYINPDYKNEFKRYSWEEYSPFQTLLARYCLILFTDKADSAVLFMHMGIVLTATLLTYFTNCLFFVPIPSFFITCLLLFDRVLFPMARGLGQTSVLLLPPLLLLFIYVFSLIQENNRLSPRKFASIIIIALSIAAVHSLGMHEAMFGILTIALLILILTSRGAFKAIGLKSISRHIAPYMIVSVILALLLIYQIANICISVIPDAKTTTHWRLATYKHFRSIALRDLKRESKMTWQKRLEVLRATFVEGQYLHKYGSHHSNTFLYPGKGFNGVIPIFILPGLLVGIPYLLRKTYLNFRHKLSPMAFRFSYFYLLNCVLMLLFVLAMILSADPKPTRYTAFVYSIYATSAMGYFFIMSFIKKKLKTKYPSYIIGLFLCLLAISLSVRLYKNYNDLQSYRKEYAKELKITYIHDIINKAKNGYKDRDVYLLFDNKKQITQFLAHPSMGLFVRYKLPPNIRYLLRSESAAKNLIPPCVIYSWNNEASRFEIETKNGK